MDAGRPVPTILDDMSTVINEVDVIEGHPKLPLSYWERIAKARNLRLLLAELRGALAGQD